MEVGNDVVLGLEVEGFVSVFCSPRTRLSHSINYCD